MKAHIVAALQAEPGRYVSGEALAAQLGLTRAAVWKHIAGLRQSGYIIEAAPRRGYRLAARPDLDAAALAQALAGLPLAYRVQVHDRLPSTNPEAARQAEAGAPAGAVVIADEQTAGRGRLGRPWHSPPGLGLWVSVVLRPAVPPAACSGITLMAGVAVAEAVAEVTGLAPGLKWPNDVLVNGRKVCGILTELAAEWDKVHYLVMGIGVNVNQAAADLPPELAGTATSLRAELGRPVSRHDLCVAILTALAHRYPAWLAGGFAAVRTEWLARSVTIGRQVEARSAGGVIAGLAEDVGHDGSLLIRQPDGAGVRVTSGEVTLRPAGGERED